jgi:hypothetical protein
MTAENLGDEQWFLGESIGLQGRMNLELMREMSSDESRASIRALNLISRLTTSSKWNDVLGAWRTVEANLGKTSFSANSRMLDEAVFRLLHALRRFHVESTDVRAGAAGTFVIDAHSATNPQWEAIAENLARLPTSPFRCIYLVDVVLKPGQVRTRIALTAEAAVHLGLVGQQVFDARVWLETATALAEQENAAILRALEVEITESARILQRLGAEVLIGATVLVSTSDITALERGETFSPKIHEVPLEHIPRLMLALRDAKNAVPWPGEREEPDPERVTDFHDPAAVPPKGDAGGSPTRTVTPQAAIDPAGLHTETNRMSAKLQRLWTKSLERVITDDVLADELSRWHTLLASSTASMLSEEDSAAEIRFPLSAIDVVDFVASKSDVPGPVTHLYSVALLSKAIHDFTQPRIVVDPASGSLEAWWNSGGFARLRDAGDLLLRGISETSIASNQGAADRSTQSSPLIKTALALANRCLQVGAPEAALTYLLQAWDEFTESRDPQTEPEDSEEAMAAFAVLLPALRDAATRFGSGERIPLRVALPLAFTGLDIMNRLDGIQVSVGIVEDDDNN